MSETPKLALPKELEIYRKQIEGTVKPYIKISASKRKTTIFQSKFAGNPYLPKTIDYPKDLNNKPMKLLAQLNFEELPMLEVKEMPKQGILQFFISAEDDVMGMDFDDMTSQNNFKIVFHPHVEKDESLLITDFSYMTDLDTEYFPIQDESALTFSVDYEPVFIEDYKIDKLLGETVNLSLEVSDGDNMKELWEIYSDTFLGDGHKIGGYPYFTQGDPRGSQKRYTDHDILLLQIDSDDDNGIMWGDSGIANFFIKKEDLLNLNFSNVIYNWDCH
jgi:uncharacterized protein YwqG